MLTNAASGVYYKLTVFAKHSKVPGDHLFAFSYPFVTGTTGSLTPRMGNKKTSSNNINATKKDAAPELPKSYPTMFGDWTSSTKNQLHEPLEHALKMGQSYRFKLNVDGAVHVVVERSGE
ncbi:hypothetical protein AKO1_012249, partial [Acrasis kona]